MYGASDKERELNELEAAYDALTTCINEMDEYHETFYNHNIDMPAVDELQRNIQEKIDELRNPQSYEDYILERAGL